MTTRIHPFDFTALRKGTWIETAELEQAATCLRTEPAFGLRVLGLKCAIEMQTGILARVEGERLRLMTDSEAVIWCVRQAGEASRQLERNARRLRENIDPGKLTLAEQAVHENAQRVVTAMALSQREQRRRHERLFALAHASED